MGLGEGDVIRRVPVLHQHHMPEAVLERVDRLDHRVAPRDGERPARQEIDLHVDDEEQVGVAGRHGRGPQGSITIEPVVSRPARSRWTCCASASG